MPSAPSPAPASEKDLPDRAPWRCPSCGVSGDGRFCSACGEKRLDRSDLTLRHLVREALDAFTQLDGRLGSTLVALLTRPGALTAAWLEGRRRPYLGPAQIFVLANVVFFLVQWATRLDILSVPLRAHLDGQFYSAWAQRAVQARLAAHGLAFEAFAQRFDQLTDLQARTLVIVMAPAFALVCAAILAHRRRPAAAHLTFALHLFAFLMLAISVVFLATALFLLVVGRMGLSPSPHSVDWAVSAIELSLCVAFLWPALRRVYGLRPLPRAAATAALLAVVPVLLFGYRLLLLVLTLHTA